MNKALVIARLREHEPELKAAGITRLFLFGSVARGERGNDVDLMAEFDASRRLTLFDKAGLEVRLAEILDVPVDLCERQMLKEPVKARAEREAVLALGLARSYEWYRTTSERYHVVLGGTFGSGHSQLPRTQSGAQKATT